MKGKLMRNNVSSSSILYCLVGIWVLIACTPTPDSLISECGAPPVIVPTLPAFIPEEFELDPTTNLHKSGTPQLIDVDAYTLEITGLVDQPLSLTYDQLRCMPKVTDTPTLVCPQTFFDTAEWSGVRLAYILKLAGVQEGATNVRMKGADGYYANISLEDAMRPESFLAYEWEGEPLPIMHGFPLRAVLPDIYGSQWVKWLLEIEIQ
jgi:DMSO/TMAO reductase YedYZ molybdopterin-dependent catalytic subunit